MKLPKSQSPWPVGFYLIHWAGEPKSSSGAQKHVLSADILTVLQGRNHHVTTAQVSNRRPSPLSQKFPIPRTRQPSPSSAGGGDGRTTSETMAPTPEPRRPYKRPAISDQQRRRELALQAQSARRADAQARARALATSLLTTRAPTAATSRDEEEEEYEHEEEEEERELTASGVAAAAAASRLRGSEARRWFARQVMLPEWMVDAPPHLATDWSVLYLSFCLVYLSAYVNLLISVQYGLLAAIFFSFKGASFPHLPTNIHFNASSVVVSEHPTCVFA
jgi:hypothetical protein